MVGRRSRAAVSQKQFSRKAKSATDLFDRMNRIDLIFVFFVLYAVKCTGQFAARS
jgi:hypothetical protein